VVDPRDAGARRRRARSPHSRLGSSNAPRLMLSMVRSGSARTGARERRSRRVAPRHTGPVASIGPRAMGGQRVATGCTSDADARDRGRAPPVTRYDRRTTLLDETASRSQDGRPFGPRRLASSSCVHLDALASRSIRGESCPLVATARARCADHDEQRSPPRMSSLESSRLAACEQSIGVSEAAEGAQSIRKQKRRIARELQTTTV
jgi:hypothetical protein